MNDYNRGALPDPCLRLDFGFGEQWESIELGDGTGYVRLSDWEELKAENAKLRGLCADMLKAMRHMEERVGMDVMVGYSPWFAPKLHELGVEVDA